jgi:hypothetical protein
MNKIFNTDAEFLGKLNSVLLEIKHKNNLSSQMKLILENLERLKRLALGLEELKMEQKYYSDTHKWLSELDEIYMTKICDDYMDLHDYFANSYSIPKAK